MKNSTVRTLCRVAVLIALEIVFSRFLSLNTQNLRIGIGFVPIALCGILYGPWWAGAAAGIADVLGTFLTPYGLYPPITLTAILTGLFFGLFLHRKNAGFLTGVLPCALVNAAGLSLGLQSYWLSLLYHTPYAVQVAARLAECAVLVILYLILLPLMQRFALKLDHLK